jgi:GNAT superfamily N-acetyltransferase
VTSAEDWSARVRAWRRSGLEAACDELTPWEFGTIARAHRYPDIYAVNKVIVERPTGLSARELVAVADRALADCARRRLDVEDVGEGRRIRGELEALGWETTVLVWLAFEGPLPEQPGVEVDEVPYDTVEALRREWHFEDYPGTDPRPELQAQLRELVRSWGARTLAVRGQGRPVAYAQLDELGLGREVAEVFVTRERRGQGLGTAVTAAAIKAALAAGPGELWICAEDEGGAWPLYEHLGFRRVWSMVEFVRRS